MPELPPRATLLVEIESRQDELLRQLDELEKKITRVLADYAASCQGKPGAAAAPELAGTEKPAVALSPKKVA